MSQEETTSPQVDVEEFEPQVDELEALRAERGFLVVVHPLAAVGAHVDLAAGDHLVHVIDHVGHRSGVIAGRPRRAFAIAEFEGRGAARRFIGEGLGLIGGIVLRRVAGFGGKVFRLVHRGSPDLGVSCRGNRRRPALFPQPQLLRAA